MHATPHRRVALPARGVLPLLAGIVAVCAGPSHVVAQEPDRSFVRRVEQDGRLVDLRWSRDADGNLHAALPDGTPQPMFERGLMTGFENGGVALWLALVLPGPNDLLALCDAEAHLRRAGVATTDAELRQFLALPLPAGDGGRTRAERLDRMVAIDLLRRRGTGSAAVELRELAGRDEAPAELRQRARDALTALDATRAPATFGGVFAADAVALPAAADVVFAMHAAAMPDPQPLLVLARTAGLRISAEHLDRHEIDTPEVLLSAQMVSEIAGELPFEIVRHFGNHRIDGVVGGVLLRGDGEPAVAVQVAGRFDVPRLAEWLRQEGAPAEMVDGELVTQQQDHTLRIGASRAGLLTEKTATRKGGDLAKALLAEGAALRVMVPENSKLLLMLAAQGMPQTRSASLALSFDPGPLLQLELQARDEDAAESWVALAEQQRPALLAELRGMLEREPPPGGLDSMQPLLQALGETKVAADGRTVTATVDLRHLGLRFVQKLVTGR